MQKTASRKDTKARLLEHSRTLFARHGYEGVSMRDIAGAVGLRQSAIYNHFSNKQDLLVTLMVSHMDHLLSAMTDTIADISEPTQKLEAFARFHVTYHIDHPEDVFLAYMELRSLEDHGRAAVIPLRRSYENSLRNILTRGIETGAFRIGDPAVTARALLAMLTGVTVWFREGGGLDRHTVAESYVQAVLQSVGAVYPLP
ncbi:MAG: TetR/AcrR family transcriptional regulator [Pseudomonadota bacterium]